MTSDLRPLISSPDHTSPRRRFRPRRLLATWVMPPVTPFLIVTRGRTGSNLLLSLLDSHPRIVATKEIIGEATLHEPGYRERLARRGVVGLVEDAWSRRGFEAARGIKLLYYQAEPDYGRHYGIADVEALLPYLQTRRDVKVLHLKRRNRLAVVCSMHVALATRQYKIDAPGRPPAAVRVRIDPAECRFEFERMARWERAYDDLFAEHETLALTYEDLADQTDREGERIQRFLGVAARRLRTRTVRQRRAPLRDTITNYAELAEAFAGTPWAVYFDGVAGDASAGGPAAKRRAS